MTDRERIADKLKVCADNLGMRQAEYVENIITIPADWEALDAAQLMREAIDALRAAEARAEAAEKRVTELEQPDLEMGWVIEHRRSPAYAPEYWAGNGWSKDHFRAIRFARQIDAELTRNGFDEDDPLPGEHPHRVANHEWVDARPAAKDATNG